MDTTIFNGKSKSSILDSVNTDFNFLFVGHWLGGDLGHDRKDVGMMLKHSVLYLKIYQKINNHT